MTIRVRVGDDETVAHTLEFEQGSGDDVELEHNGRSKKVILAAAGGGGGPGPQGDPGADGSVWRSGSGAPAGGLGVVTDWYLNTANGDIYEKTGSSTWTLRDNLTGPQGPAGNDGAPGTPGTPGADGDDGAPGTDGTDGSIWRSGSGAPAGGLGVISDWYINDANGDVYEKTGVSTWTLRDNLTGPQGSTGADGPEGPEGPEGPAGADGADGAPGAGNTISLDLLSDGAAVAFTNMPAALTFFASSHRNATKIDLTNCTQVRLIVNKQATAGAAASKLLLKYRTAFDTTVANWSDIGTSEVSVAVNVTNTVLVTSWINLAAGAKADVFVCLAGSGGDGTLDPAFGNIKAEFK